MRQERVIRVSNRFGLDICAAQRMVDLATQFGSQVSLYAHGRWADGKDIIEVITLDVRQGSDLTIRAEGEDASAAVNAIERLADLRFGEGS